MNKTPEMVALGTIQVSGLVLVSALGNSAHAQSGKEVKVDIVKGATNIKNKAYAPNKVKVQPGTKVTWTNSDTAVHTVSSGDGKKKDGAFESKIIGPKKTFSFTFDKAGTFNYYCELHPTMVGKVTVG